MVVWKTFFIINFQIILIAARSITLPMNTVTNIDSFRAELGKEFSSELENQPITRNDFAFIETQDVASLPLKLPTNSVLPKLGISYNMALAYGEECAFKYGHYNKMQPTNQSVWKTPRQLLVPPATESNIQQMMPIPTESNIRQLLTPPVTESNIQQLIPAPTEFNIRQLLIPPAIESNNQQLMIPTLESNIQQFMIESSILTKEPVQSLTPAPGLKLPLKVATSVTSINPTEINTKKTFASILNPCIDLSTLGITSNSGLPPSLSASSTVITAEPAFNFLKPIELVNSQLPLASSVSLETCLTSPVLSMSTDYRTPDLYSVSSASLAPRSTLTLPLSVSSSTCSFKLSQSNNLSPFTLKSNTPSSLTIDSLSSQLPLQMYYTSLVSSPNTLPSPLVPLLTPNQHSPLVMSPEFSSFAYNCPLVPQTAYSLPLVSEQYPEIDLTKIGIQAASLPACYTNMFTSMLPSPEFSSQGISGSSYYPNEFSFLCSSPYLSGSLSENTLFVNPHKTSVDLLTLVDLELDNTCASTNSLLSPPASPVSNCLLLSPFSSVTPTENYFSANFKTDCKSFKRSYDASEKEFKSENQVPSSYISSTDHENSAKAPSIPNAVADKFSSNEPIKKLLELISLAELLNTNDSLYKWSVLNEIYTMLNVLTDV